jgi:hypothetical protein
MVEESQRSHKEWNGSIDELRTTPFVPSQPLFGTHPTFRPFHIMDHSHVLTTAPHVDMLEMTLEI